MESYMRRQLSFLAILLVGAFLATPAAEAAGPYVENFDDAQAQGWSTSGAVYTLTGGYYKNDTGGERTIAFYGDNAWDVDYTYRVSLYSEYSASGNLVGAVYNYQNDSNFYEVTVSPEGAVKLSKTIGGVFTTIQQSTVAGVAPDQYVLVEITRNGTATTVRVNGTTAFSAVPQTELGSGRIGVLTRWDLGRFDNVQVEPLSTDYAENFDDGQAQGWTTVDTTYSVTSSYYTNDNTSFASSFAVYGGKTWATNFTYSVRLYSDFAASGNAMSAVYNYQDGGNYYEVWLSPLGTVRINKWVGGSVTQVTADGTYPDFGPDKYANVQIVRSGTSTTVRVNDATIFSNITQTELGAGKIGVSAKWNKIRVDDVAVIGSSAIDRSGPPYPRIATIRHGNPHNYEDGGVQQELARAHIAILSYYRSWDSSHHTTLNQVVQQIKTLSNTARPGWPTRVFIYNNNGEINNQRDDVKNRGDLQLLDQLDAMNWWLLDDEGHHVVSPFRSTYDLINSGPHVTRDTAGKDWSQWYATWIFNNFYSPNPLIDGFYTDNVEPQPRGAGDWDNDGDTELTTDAQAGTWFRQGFKEHYDTLRTLLPSSKRLLGNIGSWAKGNPTISPEFNNMVDGGTLENALGPEIDSVERNGWATVLSRYRVLMDKTKGEKLVILMARGGETEYQALRYSLGTTLLDNGYFSWTFGGIYNNTKWYDEYGANLGYPTSAPPTGAWQNGIWRRDFENGVVLVNPAGHGQTTVTVGPGFRHIDGAQDPNVNNGAPVTSVMLQERDGMILLRQ